MPGRNTHDPSKNFNGKTIVYVKKKWEREGCDMCSYACYYYIIQYVLLIFVYNGLSLLYVIVLLIPTISILPIVLIQYTRILRYKMGYHWPQHVIWWQKWKPTAMKSQLPWRSSDWEERERLIPQWIQRIKINTKNNKQWNMLKWKIEIKKIIIILKYWHFEWFVNQDEFIKKHMEAKYHDEILNS